MGIGSKVARNGKLTAQWQGQGQGQGQACWNYASAAIIYFHDTVLNRLITMKKSSV
jgi:hypothetical protein